MISKLTPTYYPRVYKSKQVDVSDIYYMYHSTVHCVLDQEHHLITNRVLLNSGIDIPFDVHYNVR